MVQDYLDLQTDQLAMYKFQDLYAVLSNKMAKLSRVLARKVSEDESPETVVSQEATEFANPCASTITCASCCDNGNDDDKSDSRDG